MRPSAVRLVHRVHQWTGVASAANLLVLALTGILLIFHEEIDEALGAVPPAAAVAPGVPRASLASVVEAARRREPALALRYVSADPEDPTRLFVTMQPPALHGEAGAKILTYDARTGAYLAALPEAGGITGWVLKLHTELFLGDFGKGYVAAVGVAFLVSLLTGVVIYAPFARRLGFGVVRPVRPARAPRAEGAAARAGFWDRRTLAADLHRLLGPATLVWNLVVAATGVMLAVTTWLLPYYQRTVLVPLTAAYASRPAPAHPVPLDSAVRTALRAYPNSRFTFVAFPGSDFAGPANYLFFSAGTSPVESRLLKPTLVDARDGALIAAPPLPWYLTAALLSGPLHFGDYGGTPLKVVWVGFALITVVLAGSGVYIPLARRFATRGAGSGDRPDDPADDALAEALGEADGAPALAGAGAGTGALASARGRA